MKHIKLLTMIGTALIAVSLLGGSVQAKSNDYYTANPGIIKTKKAFIFYKDANKKHVLKHISKGNFAKIKQVITVKGHNPVLKTNTGAYLTANKQFVAKTSGLSKPKEILSSAIQSN